MINLRGGSNEGPTYIILLKTNRYHVPISSNTPLINCYIAPDKRGY